MEMMPYCITTFFHASPLFVYPLFPFVQVSFSQEDNGQAFPVSC